MQKLAKRFNVVSNIFLSCAAVYTTACGAPVDQAADDDVGDVTNVEDHLWTVSGGWLWSSHDINVCFSPATAARSDFATLQEQARTWIEQSYGRVTDLRFHGWGKCASSPKHVIQLNIDDGTGGQTRGSDTQDSTRTSNLGLNYWAGFQAVLMHEFAHALGFDHEFDRDSTGDCVANHPAHTGTSYTPYDHDSITNSTYCGVRTYLSPWDVVGLQRAYGRKPYGSVVGYKNKCLSIDNEDFAYGDPPSRQVKVWDCLDTAGSLDYDLNQLFYLNNPGGDEHIWANYTHGYLDVKGGGTTNGTAVVNNTTSTAASQRWRFRGVQLRGMGDLCFDIPHANIVAGASVELWKCADANDAPEQQFDLFPYAATTSNGRGLVIAPHGSPGGLVLTVDHNASSTHGTVTLQPLTTNVSKTATQVFTFWGDGQLANQSDGLCLDATGANPQNGTLIGTYKCRFGDSLQVAQQLTIHGPILPFGASGKCLDVDVNTGPDKGSKVQIWSCNGKPQQDWDFHF